MFDTLWSWNAALWGLQFLWFAGFKPTSIKPIALPEGFSPPFSLISDRPRQGWPSSSLLSSLLSWASLSNKTQVKMLHGRPASEAACQASDTHQHFWDTIEKYALALPGGKWVNVPHKLTTVWKDPVLCLRLRALKRRARLSLGQIVLACSNYKKSVCVEVRGTGEEGLPFHSRHRERQGHLMSGRWNLCHWNQGAMKWVILTK